MRGPRRLAACLALWLVSACALGQRPAWEQPPPPVIDLPVVEAEQVQRGELDNGLEVVVLEDRRLPRVMLGVVVRRGSGSEEPARAGLAALTADAMARGAGERDALALAEATDALGASLATATDWDSASVQIDGLSRDFEALLEILADVVQRPRFEPEEVARARGERLAALQRAVDDPGTLAGWNLARALYGEHRYGAPEAGSPDTVAGLGARDLRGFHARVFLPNDAVFYAAGDVDLDTLLPLVGAAFGAWERGDVVPAGAPPPARVPPARRIVVVDRPDLVQARVALAHEGLARTDERRIAANVLNTVIGGGGFGSRLMNTLRAEGGLTYSVGSQFDLRRHPGPFGVVTFTQVAQVRQLLDTTLAELERLRLEPPAAGELQDAKALMVGQFSLGLESSRAVLSSLVNLDVYGLPRDSLATYRSRIRAVDEAEIAALAQALIHPQRMAIVLVGPAAELAPQVEDLGEVEIVTP